MVHDCNWPLAISFETAIGPLAATNIAPFCLLRTCKSDTCVGLEPSLIKQLFQMDQQWMVNGKFGIIQYRGSNK